MSAGWLYVQVCPPSVLFETPVVLVLASEVVTYATDGSDADQAMRPKNCGHAPTWLVLPNASNPSDVSHRPWSFATSTVP